MASLRQRTTAEHGTDLPNGRPLGGSEGKDDLQDGKDKGSMRCRLLARFGLLMALVGSTVGWRVLSANQTAFVTAISDEGLSDKDGAVTSPRQTDQAQIPSGSLVLGTQQDEIRAAHQGDSGGALAHGEQVGTASAKWKPAMDLEAAANLLTAIFADVSTPKPAKGSPAPRVPMTASVNLRGELPVDHSEHLVTADSTGRGKNELFGSLRLEAMETLVPLLSLSEEDHLVGLNCDETLLTMALALGSQKATSINSDASAHARMLRAVLRLADSRPLALSNAAHAMVVNARWSVAEKQRSDGDLEGATVALALGAKLQGMELLVMTRGLADSLAPGAAVAVLQKWAHCHAGLEGPVASVRVPFARLPGGGSVFVYVVAPRLTAIVPGVPRLRATEPDPAAFDAITSAVEAAGTEPITAAIGPRLMGRVKHMLGGASSASPADLQRWMLHRIAGSADTPLDCLFVDLFYNVTGSVNPATITSKEAAELGTSGTLRATYNELHTASVHRLLTEIALEAGDALVDVGFGLGKVLFQAALVTPVAARGIELVPSRANVAKAAWEALAIPGAGDLLGGLDVETAAAAKGTVKVSSGDFIEDEGSLFSDASLVVFHMLAFAGVKDAPFFMGTIVPRSAEPGTLVVSTLEPPGCHRGMRLLKRTALRVDWAQSPVVAFVYVIAPWPVAFAMHELPLLHPLPDMPPLPRGLRCLERSVLAADVDGSVENALARESLPDVPLLPRLQRMLSGSNHRPAWLFEAWLRGDELSSYDCLFADTWQLIVMDDAGRSGGSASMLSEYWRDSTSKNKDTKLENVDWSSMGGPRTYGEVRTSSLATLLAALELQPSDVFYDLGSGAGKVVLQAHLQTPVRRAAGIELEESRHIVAGHSMAQLRKLGVAATEREVEFILGNITDTSLWADATLIFMLCTCFPVEVQTAVASSAAKFAIGTRIVVASFPLPAAGVAPVEVDGKMQELRLRWHVVLPTTFSGGEPFFVYEVSRVGAGDSVHNVPAIAVIP